jgi:hypothetical protein
MVNETNQKSTDFGGWLDPSPSNWLYPLPICAIRTAQGGFAFCIKHHFLPVMQSRIDFYKESVN